MTTRTSDSITGTSTSTPTTVASAAPDSTPNSTIAVATASSGSPNNRLNIALIGVGGRGRAAITDLKTENFVAFCDVDEVRASETFKEHPDVPRFSDYRQMLDKISNQIDAVTISTPDHMHYPIAVAALQLGKHVFIEKPMTHNISETYVLF